MNIYKVRYLLNENNNPVFSLIKAIDGIEALRGIKNELHCELGCADVKYEVLDIEFFEKTAS
jgi:hypothetical protein